MQYGRVPARITASAARPSRLVPDSLRALTPHEKQHFACCAQTGRNQERSRLFPGHRGFGQISKGAPKKGHFPHLTCLGPSHREHSCPSPGTGLKPGEGRTGPDYSRVNGRPDGFGRHDPLRSLHDDRTQLGSGIANPRVVSAEPHAKGITGRSLGRLSRVTGTRETRLDTVARIFSVSSGA